MQTRLILLFVGLLSAVPLAVAAPVDEKAESTNRLLSIIARLDEIARRQTVSYPEEAVRQRIDSLVDKVTASDDLARLALLCHGVIGDQAAEHASYDGVFDYAMWHCAILISRRPGPKNGLTLSSLRRVIGYDGGGSLTMRRLIEEQQKLPVSKQ